MPTSPRARGVCLFICLSLLLVPSALAAPGEDVTHRDDTESAQSAASLRAALAGRDIPNVYIRGAIPAPALSTVGNRLAQAPQAAVDATDSRGLRSLLFTGTITAQPDYAHLAGGQVGSGGERSWDSVCGLGNGAWGGESASDRVGNGGFSVDPVADANGTGGGALSCALHEFGHLVDEAIGGGVRVSQTAVWTGGPYQEIINGGIGDCHIPNRPYYVDNGANGTQEWYAEAFDYFSFSGVQNAFLARCYPQTHAFFMRTLGAPRLPATDPPAVADRVAPRLTRATTARRTARRRITIRLAASDNVGVTRVRVATSKSRLRKARWKRYARAITHTVTSRPGRKTLYVQVRDAAGNLSNIRKVTTVYRPRRRPGAPSAAPAAPVSSTAPSGGGGLL